MKGGITSGVYRRDWTRAKAAFARVRTERLVELSKDWPDEAESFVDGAPSPAPILRVTPDV